MLNIFTAYVFCNGSLIETKPKNTQIIPSCPSLIYTCQPFWPILPLCLADRSKSPGRKTENIDLGPLPKEGKTPRSWPLWSKWYKFSRLGPSLFLKMEAETKYPPVMEICLRSKYRHCFLTSKVYNFFF